MCIDTIGLGFGLLTLHETSNHKLFVLRSRRDTKSAQSGTLQESYGHVCGCRAGGRDQP